MNHLTLLRRRRGRRADDEIPSRYDKRVILRYFAAPPTVVIMRRLGPRYALPPALPLHSYSESDRNPALTLTDIQTGLTSLRKSPKSQTVGKIAINPAALALSGLKHSEMRKSGDFPASDDDEKTLWSHLKQEMKKRRRQYETKLMQKHKRQKNRRCK
jgi:hypothetical protein